MLATRWRPLSIIVGLLPLYSAFFQKFLSTFLFCGVGPLFELGSDNALLSRFTRSKLFL